MAQNRAAMRAVRDRLAEQFPEAPELVEIDRVLAKGPGQPPVEPVFVRPYRLPTAAGGQ